uniref:Macin n=1 Tax=Ruditapes philippinarum TaxID=129788 RepID=A0A0P0CGQ4_RUDPH|nr:macin [Ruditapes philippinarum]APY18887.1 macin [Ruditapes philippinarum]
MKKLIISSIVAVLMISFIIPRGEAFVLSTCFETWSRCSTWSSFATGYLWKSCEDRCKGLGHNSGTCVLKPAECSTSGKAYQCQCS